MMPEPLYGFTTTFEDRKSRFHLPVVMTDRFYDEMDRQTSDHRLIGYVCDNDRFLEYNVRIRLWKLQKMCIPSEKMSTLNGDR
jgi:hypothetical protein